MPIITATGTAVGSSDAQAVGLSAFHATGTAVGSSVAVMVPIQQWRSIGQSFAIAIARAIRPVPSVSPPDIPGLICAWWRSH